DDARGHARDTHHGPHGEGAGSEGRGREHRRADGQGPSENRWDPRRALDARRPGRGRGKGRQGGGPPSASRAVLLTSLEGGTVSQSLSQPLIAICPSVLGNSDGF